MLNSELTYSVFVYVTRGKKETYNQILVRLGLLSVLFELVNLY